MPDDLYSLLNAYLDGALSEAQKARLLPRLGQAAVARRLERLRALRAAVRGAVPELESEQSRRLWAKIHGRLSTVEARGEVQAGQAARWEQPVQDWTPRREPWYALFTRPWVPSWGLGLAGALAVLAWVFMAFPRTSELSTGGGPKPAAASASARPALAPSQAGSVGSVVAAQSMAASTRKSGDLSPRTRHGSSSAPVTLLAGLPSRGAQASAAGLTEVEQALAANRVDDLADQFLTVQRQPEASVVGGMAPLPLRTATTGADTVDYQQSTTLVQDAGPASSSAPGRPQGGRDSRGFWNWVPAAQALNQRDWPQARVELRAASKQAGEAAEKVFADSALGLLSASGAPLEGSQPALPPLGEMRVLSAGTWQLLAGSRLARFGGGVSVRLPGLREDGDSFLLDLTFDHGEFAAGAHFVRVSGENPVRVIGADGQPVSSDDFYAPNGADYDIAKRALRLR